MRVLGISAHEQGSAAALVVDRRVVAAAREESFTGRVADHVLPSRAIRSCLNEAQLVGSELDRVVFYEKPLRRFERTLATHLETFPRSARSFVRHAYRWLGDRLWIRHRLAQDLDLDPSKVLFAEHLQSLAANAFLTSPFDHAALLVAHDAGEWSTTLLGSATPQGMRSLVEVQLPHSLGLFARAITQYLGFVAGEDEERVEALAAHGRPVHAEALERLVWNEGGRFALDARGFRFGYEGDRLFGPRVERALGPARTARVDLSAAALAPSAGDPLATRYADVAASLQLVLERRVLALAHELHRRSPQPALCFGGELARNRRLVAVLAERGPFERVFVPSAPGRAGGALGAALLGTPESFAPSRERVRVHAAGFLGEDLNDDVTAGAASAGGNSEGRALRALGRRLAAGEAVGLAAGPMEFGPSSLGQRSICVDARGPLARHRVLTACGGADEPALVKLVVPAETLDAHFDVPPAAVAAAERAQLRVPARERLRSLAPSLVLPDGTATPLAVDAQAHPRLHRLVTEHGRRTGHALLALADLRSPGLPLARTASDARAVFRRSTLGALLVREHLETHDRSTAAQPS